MSPALAGGFSSTLPPGSPGLFFFFFSKLFVNYYCFSFPYVAEFFVALGSYKGSATDLGWSKRL